MILYGTISKLLFVVGRNGLLLGMNSRKVHQGKDDNPCSSVNSMWTGKFYLWNSLCSSGEHFSISILLDRLEKTMLPGSFLSVYIFQGRFHS